MAKYISIPTSTASIPSFTFNTDLITSVVYTLSNQFVIWAFGRGYTFTTSANGAAGVVAAINKAILNQAGPVQIQVVMPTGVTIANPPSIGA
jgi:hypothetical protein